MLVGAEGRHKEMFGVGKPTPQLPSAVFYKESSESALKAKTEAEMTVNKQPRFRCPAYHTTRRSSPGTARVTDLVDLAIKKKNMASNDQNTGDLFLARTVDKTFHSEVGEVGEEGPGRENAT